MRNHIYLVHTTTGISYSKRIAKSLMWHSNRLNLNLDVKVVSVNQIPDNVPEPNKTLIHARAAIPNAHWMNRLDELSVEGCKIVNNTNVLKLTSDKLRSSIMLNNHFGNELCPMTWELDKDEEDNNNDVYNSLPLGKYVIKPYISMDQGANVTQFTKSRVNNNADEFIGNIYNMPTSKVVLQSFVDYIGLHRVIVINKKALPFTFVDKIDYHPNNWKVSVCLNKTTMRFNNNPDFELLNLGEKIQHYIGGNINFIDIFETRNGYVLSEINTACNLSIHERLSGYNIHSRIAGELIRLGYD